MAWCVGGKNINNKMVSKITHKGKSYNVDLAKPIDISIPLRAGDENVNAWYSAPVKIEPVRMGNWVGDVKQGGSVNFRNVFFNPHGNGTHTECVGHISKEDYSINQCLKTFFFVAELITVLPDELPDGDKVITKQHIENCLGDKRVRSGPNSTVAWRTNGAVCFGMPRSLGRILCSHLELLSICASRSELRERSRPRRMRRCAGWRGPCRRQRAV